MPELPEITCRAREMDEHLTGRTIVAVDVLQPKCLNVSVEAFVGALTGATFAGTSCRGKWLVSTTTHGYLLINLGMGGELLLVEQDRLPEKWRVRFSLDDERRLSLNFWWVGNAHYAPSNELARHAMIAKLGPNALDVSLDELREMLAGRRGAIKPFLLAQSNLAGIGNAYVHDILFRAGLHPLRSIATLDERAVTRLHQAIHAELTRSIELGGAEYEVNLLGKRGGFGASHLLVGYRENQPCPTCGRPVEKLKTGSTTSYLCPHCQPLSA